MYPDRLSLALLLTLCARLCAEAALAEDPAAEDPAAADPAAEDPAAEDPAAADPALTTSYPGADCTLRCLAKPKDGVEYTAVRWYKVGQSPSPRLSGLLTRDLPNGTTRFYVSLDREVTLMDRSSIFLPSVTCSDSGVYVCHLEAPVGEQNREGRVVLKLTDCEDEFAEDLIRETSLVICAVAVLVVAFVIFFISYRSLKNVIKDKYQAPKKETLLDAPLKPLKKKDLMLIYTLGPKKSTTMHICV